MDLCSGGSAYSDIPPDSVAHLDGSVKLFWLKAKIPKLSSTAVLLLPEHWLY